MHVFVYKSFKKQLLQIVGAMINISVDGMNSSHIFRLLFC